ncbi:ABC transporter ATP-binding protein [Helicobacter enhydrae]|uniref:ABC transporter ATP-binding protein n=1 Tax=Helicobacter enhydrae TaxID=222136 RepID=A0A1B1U4R0_9HELI|nr:ATP-binding cassette domain-containing protein [Helicobacter enhydrae]ANV97692.1 ABC transporter ATP-binding protein [Helicobacter enhydrae]
MPLLSARNLTHSFDSLLYEGVCLDCNAKESIAILGVSGSGKSTILNHLSTLLPPQLGEVDLLHHKNIYTLKQEELLSIRRLEVGIIFQAHYLFRGFSAKENLEIAKILSQQELDEGILERMGILHTLHQQVGQLSGGQQQRLSIARILSKKPKMIFADEPTGNLDKQTAEVVMDILLEFLERFDSGLVLATHDEFVASKCTRQFLLENKTFREL